MNRRSFLYALGCGTAAIAGWMLVVDRTPPPASKVPTAVPFRPRLARGVILRGEPEGGELTRADERGAQQVVCRVNEHGWRIVEGLNGRETVRSLAERIHEGFDPADLEHTEASVASFLALLGQAGLLAEPFFVNLYAAEITA